MGGSARPDTATRLRLASGLVLMTFVATHLLNHALGIVSLAAMERGRELFVPVWRSWPGTVLLYGALLGYVSQAIEREGGRVDKFIGDGIMALFGVEADPGHACRGALAAARAMSQALGRLNGQLQGELSAPLRIALGLHVGPVILGEMGYGPTASLTAIGDTVNVASRLEALAKEFGAELVASARVAEAAGVDLVDSEAREVEIRGRQRPLRIRVMTSAAALPIEPEHGPETPGALAPAALATLTRLAGLRRRA